MPMSHAADLTMPDWITPAEAAHFKTTPSYAETRAWLERLEAAAPQTIKLKRFGTSPEGRDLMLVIAASGAEFTPEAARQSGKQILLVQAGIHAGEIEGKDAGLMLLRDLSVTNRLPHLLDHAILLYEPIFNVDGHENSSPYHRINQNGPEAQGFRATAQNLNLNRDYLKADAPEMQHWLAMFAEWLPDMFVDVHTTDGADYRYDLTWYTEDWGTLDPAVKAWQDIALKQRVFPQVEKHSFFDGVRGVETHPHLLAPYLELKDHHDIGKGVANFGSGGRFSTGYVTLHNRSALLVETHMLKSYEVRVRATYDLLAEILTEFNAHPGELRHAVDQADRTTIARVTTAGAQLPLVFSTTTKPEPFDLRGVAFTHTHSDISDDSWVHYDPAKPKDLQIPFWRDLVPGKHVTLPAAYLVAAGWPQVMQKLAQHGLKFERLGKATSLDVERYWLDDPHWSDKPFESRLMLNKFSSRSEKARMDFAAGSVLVTLDQRAANVAVNLLEPEAPDSLLAWGFLNAIFEQKEFGDARVVEQLARDMLARDPKLTAEFESRLKHDAAFAANPEARLDFFYRRSPWYARQNIGLYPVARLDAAALAAARAAQQ